MTCADYRRLNATPEAFLQLSRAERSASYTHFHDCIACRAWQAVADRRDPPTEEQKQRCVRLYLQDVQDPESAVYGQMDGLEQDG